MSVPPPGWSSTRARPLPPDADATRDEHLRALLRDGTALKLGLGAVAGVVVLAVLEGNPGVLKFGIVAGPLLVALMLFLMADGRAARDFFTAYAGARGLTHAARGDLPAVTPLLAAGDRRRAAHLMSGRLPGTARMATLALYTFDVRKAICDGDGRDDDYESHHFTACLVDVPEALRRFRGVYLRPRTGAFGHDWLRRHPRVELESIEFHEAYRLHASHNQDPGALRELFSPALMVRLLEHPLRPGLELGAGGLCVFVPGKLEDAAGLDAFTAAACELCGAVERELEEAGALIGR